MQPPIPEWNDAPQVGFCINVEWATLVSGLLARGESEAYWDLDAARGAQGIRHIQEEPWRACAIMKIAIISHRTSQDVNGGALGGPGVAQLYPITEIEQVGVSGFSISSGRIVVPGGRWQVSAWHVIHPIAVPQSLNSRLTVFGPNTVVARGGTVRQATSGTEVWTLMSGFWEDSQQRVLQWEYFHLVADTDTRALGVAYPGALINTFGQITFIGV